MNVARVFDRLCHHVRRLRILNGFGFRRHCCIIDTQGAHPRIVRRDGVQRRMFSRPLALFTGFSMTAISCASFPTFSEVSGSRGPAVAIALPLRWDESAIGEEEIARSLIRELSGENSWVTMT